MARNQRSRCAKYAADRSCDGNIVAVMEGDTIAYLEVFAYRGSRDISRGLGEGERNIRLRWRLQIDCRVRHMSVAQIENWIVDRHPAIVHRCDTTGMEGTGIATEESHRYSQAQVNANGECSFRFRVQRTDYVLQTVQIQGLTRPRQN